MEKNSIEFSAIPVTKSLKEAIKGAAELCEQSMEDYVHKILATWTWQTLKNRGEVVLLRGESVDEDFELLKHHREMKRQGHRVVLLARGDSDQMRIIAEAHSKMNEWLKVNDDKGTHPYDPFELLLKNIEHEDRWNLIKFEKYEELQAEGFAVDDCDRSLKEEEKKYREKHGYLESEIPVDPAFGIQASALIPETSINPKEILELVGAIEDGNFSLKDILVYILLWREAKRKVIKLVGKERVKKVRRIVRKHIRDAIDEGLDKFDK